MAIEIPETAACLGCGYVLHGLPEPVCPECGRSFDPTDPSTFVAARGPLRGRYWAGAPPTWHWLGAAAVAAAVLNAASTPGDPYPMAMCNLIVVEIGKWFLLFIILDYAYRAFAAVRERRKAGRGARQTWNRRRWRWFVTPLCLGLVASIWLTKWPMYARFYLSRPAFEKVAQTYLAGVKPAPGPRWLGLYYVERVFRYRAGRSWAICFQTGDWPNAAGFAYRPHDSPPGPSGFARTWHVEAW